MVFCLKVGRLSERLRESSAVVKRSVHEPLKQFPESPICATMKESKPLQVMFPHSSYMPGVTTHILQECQPSTDGPHMQLLQVVASLRIMTRSKRSLKSLNHPPKALTPKPGSWGHQPSPLLIGQIVYAHDTYTYVPYQ